jgi:hypothetical protein
MKPALFVAGVLAGAALAGLVAVEAFDRWLWR